MVEYLIRNFSKKYNTVLISRGYKRSTNGYVRATNKSNPSSIGDEPFQILKSLIILMLQLILTELEEFQNILRRTANRVSSFR